MLSFWPPLPLLHFRSARSQVRKHTFNIISTISITTVTITITTVTIITLTTIDLRDAADGPFDRGHLSLRSRHFGFAPRLIVSPSLFAALRIVAGGRWSRSAMASSVCVFDNAINSQSDGFGAMGSIEKSAFR